MKKTVFPSVFTLLLITVISGVAPLSGQQSSRGWKAGTSRMVITPEEPIWMAGYGSRDHPSEGTLADLWAKAVAVQDSNGNMVVLVTTDLLGIPQKMSNRIRDRIGSKYGLTRAGITLSSSHTHSGPVLQDALSDIYPLEDQHRRVISKYSDDLENRIVNLVGKAIKSMQPAEVYSGNGVTRFQVNRRNNVEKNILNVTELKGPNEYSVPVLKVTDLSGKIIAVVFGYACHATCLSLYQFSGDYPGFAQTEIEKLYPEATAMFFQGAGADQNPLPRRTIQLAQQYGRELAAAVDRVLNEDMKKLDPVIQTAYSEIQLGFQQPPSESELQKMAEEQKDYNQRWAENQLKRLQSTGSLLTSYPYPMQVWKLGDQAIFMLGGELVIQYAIELKKMFGQDAFVMGYANDEMAYIPSEIILEEGGYEGDTSQKVYGMPSKWEKGIQGKILGEFQIIAPKAGVKELQNEYK